MIPSGLILGIESSQRHVSVAIVECACESLTIRSQLSREASREGDVIMSLIDEVTREAKCMPADLAGVVVSVGPGGFTGVRMGVASAQAIAESRGIPIAAVTSARGVVQRVSESSQQVAIALASKGESCWLAQYSRVNRKWIEQSSQCVASSDALGTLDLVCFDAFAPSWLKSWCVERSVASAEPIFLAAAVVEAACDGGGVWHSDPAQVLPLYAHSAGVTVRHS